jgi:hypothetical protein
MPRHFDIGVDVHGFAPVGLAQLIPARPLG